MRPSTSWPVATPPPPHPRITPVTSDMSTRSALRSHSHMPQRAASTASRKRSSLMAVASWADLGFAALPHEQDRQAAARRQGREQGEQKRALGLNVRRDRGAARARRRPTPGLRRRWGAAPPARLRLRPVSRALPPRRPVRLTYPWALRKRPAPGSAPAPLRRVPPGPGCVHPAWPRRRAKGRLSQMRLRAASLAGSPAART